MVLSQDRGFLPRRNCYILRTTRHGWYFFLLIIHCVMLCYHWWLLFALMWFGLACLFVLWRLHCIFDLMGRILWFVFFSAILWEFLLLVVKGTIFSIWNFSFLGLRSVVQTLGCFAKTLLTFFSAIFCRDLVLGDFPFLYDFTCLGDKWLSKEVYYNLMVNSITIFLTFYIFLAAW